MSTPSFDFAQGQGLLLESSSSLTEVPLGKILSYTGGSTSMLFPAANAAGAEGQVAGFVNTTGSTMTLTSAGGSFYTYLGLVSSINVSADGGAVLALSDGANWNVIAEPPSSSPTYAAATIGDLTVTEILTVSGVGGATFNDGIGVFLGASIYSGGLSVSGGASVDSLTVSGGALTVLDGANISAANISGILYANGSLEVTGGATIDDLTVVGVSTSITGNSIASMASTGVVLSLSGNNMSVLADGSITLQQFPHVETEIVIGSGGGININSVNGITISETSNGITVSGGGTVTIEDNISTYNIVIGASGIFMKHGSTNICHVDSSATGPDYWT